MNNFFQSFKSVGPLENFHIFLWLIKDTCWVLELRWLGVGMVAPAFLVAVYLVWLTRKVPTLYVNISVLFWISANSFWMIAEFFGFEAYKYYAVFPFLAGLASFFIYMYKLSKVNTNN